MFKQTIILSIVLLIFSTSAHCQENNLDKNGLILDTVHDLTEHDLSKHGISLSQKDNWIYHQGHDPSWSAVDIDVKEWQRITPAHINESFEDTDGRIEGWYRFKFSVNDSVSRKNLYLVGSTWAASEVYLDGRLIGKFGELGTDEASFEEFINSDINRRVPIHLESSKSIR